MMRSVQRIEFADRPAIEPRAVRRLPQTQLGRNRHLLIERHSRIFTVSHPGDLDSPAVGGRDVAIRLGGVEVVADFAAVRPALFRELYSVEAADEIIAVAAPKN